MIVTVSFGFSRIVMNSLLKQTKEEITFEVQKTIALINTMTKEGKNTNLQLILKSSDSRPFRLLRTSTRFVDIEYAVIAANGNVVFQTQDDVNIDELLLLAEAEGVSNEYIASLHRVSDGSNNFSILFFGSLKDLTMLQRQFTVVLIIAMLIAGTVGLILLFFIQRRLLKPLDRLGRVVDEYQVGDKVELAIKHQDEIGSLAQSFMQLTATLNRSKERQDIFFQNASHELKTPLMSIQGYAEAIMDGVVEGDEVNESLSIIAFESQRLKHIVEEMIYLTHLEGGDIQFNPQRVWLSEVIENACASVSPLYQGANVSLDVKGNLDQEVFIDQQRMIQVLVNILGNNVRYADSKVLMRVEVNDEMLYIDVIDDGPGFQTNDLDMIFDRFYKGKKGKHGIGLSIAKTIIESQGGSIKADNHIDGGAVFRIKLSLKG